MPYGTLTRVESTGFSGGVPARVAELRARFGIRAPSSRAAPKQESSFASTLSKEITATREADPATTSSSSADVEERVVAEAKKYLGIPYVWGGNDPKVGLDCSSFTQQVYRAFGIELPRVSQDQMNVGTRVASLDQARPGDLIVYNGGGHIGIYIGNGKLIHAPHTGEVIKIDNVWGGITTIRRVLPSGPAAAPEGTSSSSGSGRVADDSVSDVPYAELFRAAGAKHGVSPKLLAAIAKAESGFNPNAVSPAGAIGLMQFMPGTAASFGIDPRDPAQAVDGAARYMKSSLDMFGRLDFAIASYNAGPGAVKKHGGIPPYAETQNYVRKVLKYMDEV